MDLNLGLLICNQTQTLFLRCTWWGARVFKLMPSICGGNMKLSSIKLQLPVRSNFIDVPRPGSQDACPQCHSFPGLS